MNALDVVKAAFKALEDHDWAGIDRLTSDDMQFVGPMPQPIGKQEFIGLHKTLLTAMPDWRFNVTDLVASGDRVSGYLQVEGTQTGEINLPGFPSIPVTGKHAKNPVEPISFEVKNGKITRIQAENVPGGGVPGLLSQLGVTMPH